jgi:hypothetical protein
MERELIGPEQVDFFTGYQVNISSDHAYIHKGIGFNIAGESPSVAAAATFAVAIQVPVDTYVHLRPTQWSTTANIGELKLFEGSTFSSGSAATPLNRNRNSKNVSKCTVTTGVTATNTSATLLLNETAGTGGNPSSSSGGGGGQNDEWVLKPNRTYVFQFENIGATTATVFYYNFFFYEESAG